MFDMFVVVGIVDKVDIVEWFASKVFVDDVVRGAVGGWRGGVEL